MKVPNCLLRILKMFQRFPGHFVIRVVVPANQVLQVIVLPAAVDNLCNLILLMTINHVGWWRRWPCLLRNQLRRALAQSFDVKDRVDTPGCRQCEDDIVLGENFGDWEGSIPLPVQLLVFIGLEKCN